jgi:DNA-binding CsgD family transcriptional regulator
MPPAVFLKERFELTPAEARLVLRLIAGESLRSAAKALNIGYETARTTLKSVFHKTGTCRQAELVIVVINAMNICADCTLKYQRPPPKWEVTKFRSLLHFIRMGGAPHVFQPNGMHLQRRNTTSFFCSTVLCA